MPGKQRLKPTLVKSVFNVLYLSHAIQFIMRNINSYLKSRGYLVPHSVFDESLRAYTKNKTNWIKSKLILSKMIAQASDEHKPIIVVIMPEFDMLTSRSLFDKADAVISRFFNEANVPVVNPLRLLQGLQPRRSEVLKIRWSSECPCSQYPGRLDHAKVKAVLLQALTGFQEIMVIS